jgi:hypothetical protein
MATEKQVRFAMMLLDKAGFSIRFMNSSYKALGATMRERSGRVEDWVRNKSVAEASSLINALKDRQPYKAAEDPEVRALRSAGEDSEVAELRRIAGVN